MTSVRQNAQKQKARPPIHGRRPVEMGHGRFLVEMVPLADLKPHPLNDEIYKRIDPDSPDMRALTKSVRRLGILEPLVVTTEGYIVSGHRRFASATKAGLKQVPGRRLPFASSDPAFPRLLVAFNAQRTKSADEILREEFILTDPDAPHRELVEHRKQQARVKVDGIQIEGKKTRSFISAAKAPFLAAIKTILDDLKDFWPVSDRQIHYGLLNAPPLIHASKPASRYRNDAKFYKCLVELLTRARIAGLIPFEAIHDPTRPVTFWNVHLSANPFIREEVNGFLKNYWRDLLQSQPNFVMMLGEKNTIEPIIRPVAMEYTVPFMIGRGYSSLPPRHDIATRFKKSGKTKLILLVLSDHDPEGSDICHSFARSIRDDFGIPDVHAVKVALTGKQVKELNLPAGMVAKAGSSRRKKFVERHGELVHELEALSPARLQQFVREAIESVIDMGLFRREQEQERRDAVELATARQRIQSAMRPQLDPAGGSA